ncbi:MAG TPA: two-component regulator propeller domain-containing protein [Acidobacteriaceae bacterium]|nr:two-component regulator propeller domain-containing protein [Acidobacteriaceae bacterium]
MDYKLGGGLEQSLLLPSGDKFIDVPFNNLLQDHEGSLWLSTNGQGLTRIRKQIVTVLSTQEGLPNGNVYPIYQDHAGDIWIGTWGGGLARYRNGKLDALSPAEALDSSMITSIGEDRDGVLWVGTIVGLYRGTNDHFERVHEKIFAGAGNVMAIYQDPAGALWFGTSGGLIRLLDGKWTSFHKEDGLASNNIRVLLRGRAGNLWIGGYGGLTSLNHGIFQHWTEADGLPSNSVRSLYEDPQGVLWIGTYDGGLGRLKDGHLTRYNVQDGLFASGVFQILEDDSGYLWMTSNRGIYRVAKKELNLFAEGKLKVISSVSYGKADGMRNAECNGGFSPAGIRARDGKLWFPTQDGVAVVDPSVVRPLQQAPGVVIESLSVDHVTRPLNQAIRIMPGQDNIEIAYTAPTLIDPDQIQFKYQLAGLDRDWITASTRRTAYYAHVPAGEYDFKVIAANSDGVWNSQGAQVHLSVLPRFYETSWFEWLTAFAGILVLVVSWRLRTQQFERETARQRAISGQLIASQESERKRIAAELHDSLGQQLLMIKNWAGLAMREAGVSTAHQSLTEISDTASKAIQEVREISYNLRPLQLERLGLTTAIKDLVQQVAASSAIHFAARIAPVDGGFAPDAEMSIYRICQESLNNIVRHSEATEATICLDRDGDRVDIVIGDNGRGFSPAEDSRPEPGKGGFGLVGIDERVRMLGGRLSVRSSPGAGTVISISLHWQRRHP